MSKLGIRINDLLYDFLDGPFFSPVRKLRTEGNPHPFDLVTEVTFSCLGFPSDRVSLQLGDLLGFGNLGGRT